MRSWIGVALVMAFGSVELRAQAGPPWPEPLVDDVVALLAAPEHLDEIWPGFRPGSRPFMVVGPDATYLFTRGDPVPGFEEVPEGSVPSVLRHAAYSRPGPPDGGVLVVDGAVAIPVGLGGADGVLANGYTQVEVIVHESFHAWQLTTWTRSRADPRTRCVPQRYDEAGVDPPPGFAEAIEAEVAALADAITARDGDRIERTRRFLDVRRRRLEAAGPMVGAIDRRQERLEGAAQFVGLRASLALRRANPEAARRAAGDSLAAALRTHSGRTREEGATPTQEAASRAYIVGAGMLVLLDGLHAGEWWTGIARGDHVDTLLARSVGAADYARAIEALAARACATGSRPGPLRAGTG